MPKTHSSRVALPTIVCVLLVLPASGCRKQGGEGFNNTLASSQSKIEAIEKKMEDLIEFSLNKKEEEAKLKGTAEEFSEAVGEARTTFDALTVPEMESAKKFHEGFDQYLKIQEEAAKEYKALVDPATHLGPTGSGRIRDNLAKLRTKREQTKQQLLSLQQAYAREAGLKMKK